MTHQPRTTWWRAACAMAAATITITGLSWSGPSAHADEPTPDAPAPAAAAPADTAVAAGDTTAPATPDATPDATPTDAAAAPIEVATTADAAVDTAGAPAALVPASVPIVVPPLLLPVHIFTFNDFHGQIAGTVTPDGSALAPTYDTAGNFSGYGPAMNFAYTLESLALATPNDSMVVSAGDNISASLFASAIDGDLPTIRLLNDIAAAPGVNFLASGLGNHEFDHGLAGLQNTIVPQMSGWEYTSANVVDKASGQPVFSPWTIYTLGNGLKVGVVAADTTETTSMVDPSLISTIDFTDPVAAVNKYADQLKDGDPTNGEANIVVAVYHNGSPVSTSLADGIAASSSFADIVNKTDSNVDAIVNGHTHQAYAWQDANGRPIVQAGYYGQNVGQIDLMYNMATGTVDAATAKNNPSSTLPHDSVDPKLPGVDVTAIGNMATVQTNLIAALKNAKILGAPTVGAVSANITTAHTKGEWVNGVYTNTGAAVRDDRANESSLATLVADAFLWAANTSPSIPAHDTDIGIINAGGGVRNELCMNGVDATAKTCLDVNGDGLISVEEANNVLNFANDIVTVDLTGAQLKQFLEEQWQTLPDGTTRPTRAFLNTGVSSNVTYTVNTDVGAATPCTLEANCAWNDPGSHVTSVFVNGQPLEMAKTYKIVTISFLTGAGDNYRVMSLGTNVRDTGLLDRDMWMGYLTQASGMSAAGGTPTKAIAPSFARPSVVVSNLTPATAPMAATTVTAGHKVTASLSRLDLTSLGSPANTTLDTYLVPAAAASLTLPDASAKIGTTTVTAPGDAAGCAAAGVPADLNAASNGCAKLDVTIPLLTEAGSYQLVSVAQPSGTIVRMALTVNAASVTFATVGWADQTITVGYCPTIGCATAAVVKAVDESGLPLDGVTIDFTATGTAKPTLSATSCVTGQGTYTAGDVLITAPAGTCGVDYTLTQVGTATIYALFDGHALPGAPMVITGIAPPVPSLDGTKSGLTGGTARAADGVDGYTLTATLTDVGGKPLPGAVALLKATPSDPAVTLSAFKDNGDGTYTLTATSKVPGLFTIIVSMNGTQLGAPVPVNFIGADVAAASVVAGATQTSDGLGFWPTEKVTVTVNSTPMNLGTFTPDAQGRVRVSFSTAGLAAGAHSVTYTGSVSGSVTVPFTVTAAPTGPLGGTDGASSPLGAVAAGLLVMGAVVLTYRRWVTAS